MAASTTTGTSDGDFPHPFIVRIGEDGEVVPLVSGMLRGLSGFGESLAFAMGYPAFGEVGDFGELVSALCMRARSSRGLGAIEHQGEAHAFSRKAKKQTPPTPQPPHSSLNLMKSHNLHILQ